MSLAVVLLLVGWLIIHVGTPPQALDGAAVPTDPVLPQLADRWPAANVSTEAGRLPDGTSYTPMLYLDVTVSFGVAGTADGGAERLLRRDGEGGVRELRRLSKDLSPQFVGLTAAGDGFVYWAEEVAAAQGGATYTIWRAPDTGAAAAVQVTADTGDAAFYDRQEDLVVADGRVHWIAVAGGDTWATQVRSVPVAGGPVQVRTVDGGYLLSAWPWLVSRGSVVGPVVLLHLVSGARVVVGSAAAERVACTPAWCRAVVVTTTGAQQIDVMRPDGSQRRRIGAGSLRSATSEVAPLGRFEIVAGGGSSGEGASRLLLYDLAAATLTVLTDGVGSVRVRQGVVWWSMGEQDAAVWHVLDLRTLPV